MSAPTHGLSHLSRPAGEHRVWAACWCDTTEVPVDLDAVRRCETTTCGRLGCHPPDQFTPWEADA